MEKRFLTAILVTTFLLNGCVTDNENYSSFEDVTGVTISDINEFKISENVTTSSAWQYQYDDYTFLNTKYVKVSFNIKNELLDKPLSDGGGAMCLHFMTDVLLETYLFNIILSICISVKKTIIYIMVRRWKILRKPIVLLAKYPTNT